MEDPCIVAYQDEEHKRVKRVKRQWCVKSHSTDPPACEVAGTSCPRRRTRPLRGLAPWSEEFGIQ